MAQLTQQTFNMESAALATENLRNTMATVDAMKQANKELKKQYGKFDIDKIEVRLPVLLGGVRTHRLYCARTYTMRWKICSSKQMKSKNH